MGIHVAVFFAPHYLVHTSGAPAYKAHDQFSRKKKDFKCALWSVKHGKCECDHPICCRMKVYSFLTQAVDKNIFHTIRTPISLLSIGCFAKHLTTVFWNAPQTDVAYVVTSDCFEAYVTYIYVHKIALYSVQTHF